MMEQVKEDYQWDNQMLTYKMMVCLFFSLDVLYCGFKDAPIYDKTTLIDDIIHCLFLLSDEFDLRTCSLSCPCGSL